MSITSIVPTSAPIQLQPHLPETVSEVASILLAGNVVGSDIMLTAIPVPRHAAKLVKQKLEPMKRVKAPAIHEKLLVLLVFQLIIIIFCSDP